MTRIATAFCFVGLLVVAPSAARAQSVVEQIGGAIQKGAEDLDATRRKAQEDAAAALKKAAEDADATRRKAEADAAAAASKAAADIAANGRTAVKDGASTGEKAYKDGVNAVQTATGQAQSHLSDLSAQLKSAGVPGPAVDWLLSPVNGVAGIANSLAHGRLPAVIDILKTSPSFAFLGFVAGSVTSVIQSITQKLAELAKIPQEWIARLVFYLTTLFWLLVVFKSWKLILRLGRFAFSRRRKTAMAVPAGRMSEQPQAAGSIPPAGVRMVREIYYS